MVFLKEFFEKVGKELIMQDLSQECVRKKKKSYFSTKTYVVGTQKNCLNETVLLSTQNIC